MVKLSNRDIDGYWNVKRVMEIENLAENNLPKVESKVLIETTPGEGTPFQCSSLNNAAKVIKVLCQPLNMPSKRTII